MDITIDLEDAEPLFAQLISQIKAAVQSGRLKPGDPLPSIRQLATDLELNNKTVAKAYSLLERDSVVQMRGYRGTYIHPDARANSESDLDGQTQAELGNCIAGLRRSGVTDSEIRKAFNTLMNGRSIQGV